MPIKFLFMQPEENIWKERNEKKNTIDVHW